MKINKNFVTFLFLLFYIGVTICFWILAAVFGPQSHAQSKAYMCATLDQDYRVLSYECNYIHVLQVYLENSTYIKINDITYTINSDVFIMPIQILGPISIEVDGQIINYIIHRN